jgi:hypothetical protein
VPRALPFPKEKSPGRDAVTQRKGEDLQGIILIYQGGCRVFRCFSRQATIGGLLMGGSRVSVPAGTSGYCAPSGEPSG